MELKNIVKDLSYKVDIRSISDNPDNKLGYYTYANLYNYFVSEDGQSYHTLVNSEVHGVRDEFCILMNDVDIILMSIKNYGFEYNIEQDLLTINLFLRDDHSYPAIIPFIFSLNDLPTLYELDILLSQESVNLYFIELINSILMLEYEMEIVMPTNMKNDLKKSIEQYIQKNMKNIISDSYRGEPVISFSKILVDDSVDTNVESFHKYNWVDVRDIAVGIFRNYEFEMAWAEDAWNILMFGDIVRSEHLIGAKHSDFEYGDVILWLVAMNNIYCSYKIVADYESSDVTDILESIYYVNNAEKFISTYLNKEVYQSLNQQLLEGKAPKCEFYNIDNGIFVFEEGSIALEEYTKEIERRVHIVKEKIYGYFNSDTILISDFMEGGHWVDNYFDLQLKQREIELKFKEIMDKVSEGYIVECSIDGIEYEYNDEDEVERDMEEALEELDKECNNFKSYAQQGPVYDWIGNYMTL